MSRELCARDLPNGKNINVPQLQYAARSIRPLKAIMTMTQSPSSDIAFTPTVKAFQTQRGSREAYSGQEERGGFRTVIDENLADFLGGIDTAYLATANSAGQPYAQHRGGPKGFIRVLDDRTLAFADYTGNKQYISMGNLADNDKAFLFLMDYANRRRIKIWGRARVSDDATVIARLMPENYRARPEQAILFKVEAWDANCPQHIPLKLDAADVASAIEQLNARIAELEAENASLKGIAR